MSTPLPPRLRAMIINYDPTQPDALTISDFCKAQKISRSIFYRIRARAESEAASALHPRSRAPRQPARRYGPEVVNELVRIRKQLKADGWDYGPKTIHYEATIQEAFPGGQVPSVATIGRLLAAVGQVDRNPRKRPKSSYLPFARSTAMALWQLDAFEFRTGDGKVQTVYQLLDDATRFDAGSWAYQRHENSHDAHNVLQWAIEQYGAPRELLSDNSKAFNQLRSGTIGAVEIFLASKGTMPITGMPGRPTTQGKNERSHQTLQRFLKANRPQNLSALRKLIQRYREHYNRRRPHQALHQSTPEMAWQILEHTPATEPLHLSVLQAKAAHYLQHRRLKHIAVDKAHMVVSKTGQIIDEGLFTESANVLAADQVLIEIKKDQRKVFYKGQHISVPSSLADRQYARIVTDDEFVLFDPDTGEVVMSFPLPLTALYKSGKLIASYSIRGIYMVNATVTWERKADRYRKEYKQRQQHMPEVFTQG